MRVSKKQRVHYFTIKHYNCMLHDFQNVGMQDCDLFLFFTAIRTFSPLVINPQHVVHDVIFYLYFLMQTGQKERVH